MNLDDMLLEIISDAYSTWRDAGADPRREPRLTTAFLVDELQVNRFTELRFVTRRRATQQARSALERLRAAGLIDFSIGTGERGRDARFWEPRR